MAIIGERENNMQSLSYAIQRILLSALSDVDKERLIENTFMNYAHLSVEECIDLLELAIRFILTDDMEGKSSAGWFVLKYLEHSHESILMEIIDVTVVERLFGRSIDCPNANEIPSLIKWCLKNGPTPVLEPIVREHVVTFVQRAHCRNSVATSDLLSSMAILLESHPACIPIGTQKLSELCQAVIKKIALLELPYDPSVLSLFIRNIRNVERLLKIIVDRTSDRRQLSAMYLKILYAIVSDPVLYPNPSPALASVLQLVDVEIISSSVQSILADHSDSESLIKLMTMLCCWLATWTRAHNLNRWVLSLMSKLEEENRIDILHAVVEQNIDTLFNVMVLPAVRPGVLPVVTQMLTTYCPSAEIFHKVVPRIPSLIAQLRKEKNNPISHDHLQAVLDISAQCMRVFPGYPDLYEPIVKAHEACWQERGLSAKAPSNLMIPQWHLTPPPAAARVGLHNLGNTCYMNSVLQSLFMTHKFCKSVLQGDVSDRFQPVSCALQRLFALLLHSRRPAISAEDLLNLTRPPGFSPGHQQDSSEFLIHLLDVLHEQEKNLYNHTYSERGDGRSEAGPSSQQEEPTCSVSAGGETLVPMDLDEDDDGSLVGAVGGSPASGGTSVQHLQRTEQIQQDRETIVRRIFGGKYQIQTQCLSCRAESSRIDPFIDLQVCFPESHMGSDSQPHELQTLVHATLSPEKLTGDNRYHCDRCQSLQEGVRIVRVIEPPQYLILILKHFQYNPVTRQRMKLMHKVHYTEILELPLATNSPRVATYRLYAAVVHSGRSVDAGHYYTFTRDAEDTWLRMDDDTISTSNSEQLNLLRPPETPYMLFYCGTAGSLQPSVDSPEQFVLSDLRPSLVQLVLSDNAAFLQEERNRNKRVVQSKALERRYRTDDDDDDENNHPGSSCGGQFAMNTPSNRFVY